MGTSFKTIRNYVRAAVLDFDSENFIYSDNALNSQINLSSLIENDSSGSYNITTPEEFSNDLNAQQTLVIALKIAIRLLRGTPESFSYRGPVTSVSRKYNNAALISDLEIALEAAIGGKFAIAIDTDLDALVQHFYRFYNELSRATSAYNGSSISTSVPTS